MQCTVCTHSTVYRQYNVGKHCMLCSVCIQCTVFKQGRHCTVCVQFTL